MKDFKSLLSQKLKTDPSKDFEQKFWGKFDTEFGKKRKAWIWIPAFVMTALVLFIWVVQPYQRDVYTNALLATELLEADEMLEDMELFMEFDEVALQEEDWDILLSDSMEAGS